MIKVYSLDQESEWKKIVLSFKKADVYYLPEYVKAFYKNGDGTPLLIFYCNNRIQAINVVIKRDISSLPRYNNVLESNMYFDYTTPYGYGGILFNSPNSKDDKRIFFEEYIQHCKEHNIITEFIRFNPIRNNYKGLKDWIEVSPVGPTISILTNDLEQTWMNYSSKNRNTIRRSRRNNVQVFWGVSKDIMHIFKNLYIETMKRDNANKYYYFSDSFFDSLYDDMKYNSLIFYAMHENRVISAAYVMIFGDKIHYHLSASDYNYRYLSPTNLLLHEVAVYAYSNKHDEVHLGGGLGGEMDNLYKFKKAFNTKVDNTFAVGKVILNQEIYSMLIEGIEKDTFFPLYRKSMPL